MEQDLIKSKLNTNGMKSLSKIYQLHANSNFSEIKLVKEILKDVILAQILKDM